MALSLRRKYRPLSFLFPFLQEAPSDPWVPCSGLGTGDSLFLIPLLHPVSLQLDQGRTPMYRLSLCDDFLS